MMKKGGIEARLMWFLLTSGVAGVLEEPGADYAGVLERMELAELLALMEKVRERLKELGVEETQNQWQELVRLFIDKKYVIRMDAADGPEIPLRPLVKALFILFLRHPEGILLKQRDQYRQELEEIYAIICPNTAVDDVKARVGRLVNLQDNSFSEKASVLNARLEDILPKGTADDYKIQGYNGHPRRIPVNPLLINWL
ncbi:MAG: hypothetical protein IKX45_02425 [Bacteroidales bacterium]|nr:hypothetical protein [Bacteroidales bacterium]